MTPIEWAIRPIKKFAQFKGRAPRAEYWWFYLLTIIVGIPLGLIDEAIGASEFFSFSGALNLALVVPWLSVTVRRFHDIDRSGWWAFALLVGMLIGVGLLGAAAVSAGFGGGSTSAASVTIMIVAALLLLGSGITMLVALVTRGTDGSNQFGGDPYGPEHGQLVEVFR